MARTQAGRFLTKTREYTRHATSRARRTLGLDPKPLSTSIDRHLRDPKVSAALAGISEAMPRHLRGHLTEALENGRITPLTRYVLYMAFLESVSPPVRPLAVHPTLAGWLLDLPNDRLQYYPADPCWECGYRYPGIATLETPGPAAPGNASPDDPDSAGGNIALDSGRDKRLEIGDSRFEAARGLERYPLVSRAKARAIRDPTGRKRELPRSWPLPSVTAFSPHPWVGRKCLYCEGEIVNHLEWLGPDTKRTLADFQKAPYRVKQPTTPNGAGCVPKTPTGSDELDPARREFLESMNLLIS